MSGYVPSGVMDVLSSILSDVSVSPRIPNESVMGPDISVFTSVGMERDDTPWVMLASTYSFYVLVTSIHP